MISSVKPLVLIPAAGFGRRMGSPLAKEILPLRAKRPLIEAPLEWCADRHWPALVITRQEKTNLIEYLSWRNKTLVGERHFSPRVDDLRTNTSSVDTLIVGATQDWPDTLLASRDHWHEWNLVLLPDVDFAPLEILDQIAEQMGRLSPLPNQLIVASHDIGLDENARRGWGFLLPTSKGVMIAEKPVESFDLSSSEVSSSGIFNPGLSRPGSADFDPGRERAWGIFAFHKSIGARLLQAQSDSSTDHQWHHLEISTTELHLKHFRDLTR